MNQLKIFTLVLFALFAIFAFECNPPPAPEPTPASAPTVQETPAFERLEDTRRALILSRAAPHLNAKASPDMRTLDILHVQACTNADGTWACAGKKPLVFKALGNEPITPVSWLVPAWFIDPQNVSGTASDHNDCVTAVTACQTWAEIAIHRFGISGGCVAEGMPQNTTITYLSSHTDGTDPMLWCPIASSNAYPVIQGTTPAVATATTFTRSAAKNTSAGANSLLAGSFAAGSPAPGVLVQNTTSAGSPTRLGSRAWIYKTAGGSNWDMTQPLAPQTVPYNNSEAEIDSWNTGDTVELLTPVAVNLVKFAPTFDTFDSSFNNGQLYQLVVFDPTGVGNDDFYANTTVDSIECGFQRRIIIHDENSQANSSYSNAFSNGGTLVQSSSMLVQSGALVGPVLVYFSIFQIDGDAILTGSLFEGGVHGFGLVYLDGFADFNAATVDFEDLAYSSHVVYGATLSNLRFNSTSRGRMKSGTYAAGWTAPVLVSPGALFNGAATASCNTGADPGVIHNATTTVAHLDTGCGAGTGLGGVAFNLGGASVGTAQ